MKKLSIVCLLAVVFASCSSHGEKHMVNNNSEVYFKGDGVTSDDAKRLGDFLLKNGYFDSVNQKTLQLTRTDDTFNIKFVVDTQLVSRDQNAEMIFTIMAPAISSAVFNSKPVKMIWADQKLVLFRELGTFTGTPVSTDTTSVEQPVNIPGSPDTTQHHN